nr:MAG TPA: hypothetical protein [Caudoviricetes sp.]
MTRRTTMMDKLKEILPTFQLASAPAIAGEMFSETPDLTDRPDDYIVLAYSHRLPSETNRLGSFAYWKVQIYVHSNSIIPIDEYGARVRRLIKSMDYEVTYSETGDYYDMTLSRYRLEIEYRIPQGGIA